MKMKMKMELPLSQALKTFLNKEVIVAGIHPTEDGKFKITLQLNPGEIEFCLIGSKEMIFEVLGSQHPSTKKKRSHSAKQQKPKINPTVKESPKLKSTKDGLVSVPSPFSPAAKQKVGSKVEKEVEIVSEKELNVTDDLRNKISKKVRRRKAN